METKNQSRKGIHKIVLFIMLLFLFISPVTADAGSFTKTIKSGETAAIDEKSVTLIAVGRFNSVRLNINGKEITLHKYEAPYSLGKYNIELLQTIPNPTTGGYAEFNLTQAIQITENKCSQNTDCNDNNLCTTDICIEMKCDFMTFGCFSGGVCLQIGAVQKEEYCSKSGALQQQKAINQPCEEDYECKNNRCVNSICSGILTGENQGFAFLRNISLKDEGGEKMHWLLALIGVWFVLKGILLIFWPRKIKNFAVALLGSNMLSKFIAILAVIIGLFLILAYFLS